MCSSEWGIVKLKWKSVNSIKMKKSVDLSYIIFEASTSMFVHGLSLTSFALSLQKQFIVGKYTYFVSDNTIAKV